MRHNGGVNDTSGTSGDASVDLPTEEEWRATLPPERHAVLRLKGTEPAFSGQLLHNTEAGTYLCAGCGAAIFRSDDKFDSGTGWPSFTRAASDGAVAYEQDRSLGMVRTEIHCARCGGHLGHVFDDGPAPTGKRYCVNSLSLELTPAAESGPRTARTALTARTARTARTALTD